jgi:hypothetical protein
LGHLTAIRSNPLAAQRSQVPQGMSRVPDSSQKPLHQRLTSPNDEEVDPLLQQTGCAAPYTALEVWGRAGAAAVHCGGERRCLAACACALPLPSCLADGEQ